MKAAIKAAGNGIKSQANNMSHFSKSRKLVVVMFWQSVFTALLWFGKLDQTTYRDLTVFILGAYLIVNVAQKSKWINEKLAVFSPQPIPPVGSGD